MKKSIFLFFFTAFLFPALWGCSDNSISPIEGEQAAREKQFVWNALNSWYWWQDRVSDLADNRFPNNQDYHDFLNGISSAEAVFERLRHTDDRFSWFIEDYEVQEQQFQGISKSFGYSYGLVRINGSNNLFGYVQYVLQNSPAEQADLKRGDLFTHVDGTQLTGSNFSELLSGRESYSLGLATSEGNTISPSGETVHMVAEEIHENPVFLYKVLQAGSSKVGYLVYNAFRRNYHEELNEAFGLFVTEGIDELVLDLRYNSGGQMVTSQVLASMISGLDDTQIFAQLVFNDKWADEMNDTVFFRDDVPLDNNTQIPMNRLFLNRLYVLTGYRTASASEAIINGLLPFYQDDIILIGEQTVGKDDASITLYDAPPGYWNRDLANQNHKNALQPIVAIFYNSVEQDYPNGFSPSPDNEIYEYSHQHLENMPQLGDETEPLLARALELISGEAPIARALPAERFEGRLFMDSSDLQPFSKGMHFEPGDLDRSGF